MEGKGTDLALATISATTALALLLIYIAWKRPDIHDHMLGAVLGAILLMTVLFAVALFFTLPGNRRPVVFFLVFFILVTLPGSAFLIARAYTGLRINAYDLDAMGIRPVLIYLLPYLLLVALIFIRLVSWSMTFEPVSGARAISAQELRQRLLMMNDGAEFPFSVTPGKRADEVIVDWKYADATWVDLMRVHKISSLSRFIIRFDETDHTARVREQQIQFNASAGLGGLSLSGDMKWGAITFYEYRRETLYGIQIEHGRPVAKLSYSYEFDIREMRDPLLKLTTENGWRFKCVPLTAKWLTG